MGRDGEMGRGGGEEGEGRGRRGSRSWPAAEGRKQSSETKCVALKTACCANGWTTKVVPGKLERERRLASRRGSSRPDDGQVRRPVTYGEIWGDMGRYGEICSGRTPSCPCLNELACGGGGGRVHGAKCLAVLAGVA